MICMVSNDYPRTQALNRFRVLVSVDIFAVYSLVAGVGYVLKYVTKVNNELQSEKVDRELVLSLALM